MVALLEGKYGSGPYQDGKQILTQCWDYVETTQPQ